MRRSQISMEFILVFLFAAILFVFLLVVVVRYFSSEDMDGSMVRLRVMADTYKEHIDLSRMDASFLITLDMPGYDYNVVVDGRDLYVRSGNLSVHRVVAPDVVVSDELSTSTPPTFSGECVVFNKTKGVSGVVIQPCTS